MLVLGLVCDDASLCQSVAHTIETRHPDAISAPSVSHWLYELSPVVGTTPEMVIVLNIYDNTDANMLRRNGGLIVHLSKSTRIDGVELVNGDYLLQCKDGGMCYDRIRDLLHDIQRESRLCG